MRPSTGRWTTFDQIFGERLAEKYSQGEQLTKRIIIRYLNVDGSFIAKIVAKLYGKHKEHHTLEYTTI